MILSGNATDWSTDELRSRLEPTAIGDDCRSMEAEQRSRDYLRYLRAKHLNGQDWSLEHFASLRK